MNKIHTLLLATIALFIASSCTIEQTINYNADMSGSNTIIIDYGEVMDQMGDLMGDSANLGDDEMDMSDGLGDLEESFGDLEGVHNLDMINESSERRMGFSFEFDDTKALNEAMAGYLDSEETGGKKKKAPKNYKAKKKALILNFANQDMSELTEGLGDPSMAAMMGMFDYELTIKLPNRVKSVSNPLYSLSEDRKTLNATVSLEELTTGEEDLSTKIKW